MEEYTVCHSATKGRHVVATRKFSSGEVVLWQEAYATVLYDDQVHCSC